MRTLAWGAALMLFLGVLSFNHEAVAADPTVSTWCQQPSEKRTRRCRQERRKLEAEQVAEEERDDEELDEDEFEAEVDEEHAKDEIPEVLNVEERQAEMHRFEITPYGGAYIGDSLNASWLAGGLAVARLTPELSIGFDFFFSRIAFDPQGSFGSTVTNRNEFGILGVLEFNLPAAFISLKKVVEADFFTSLGGGILRINNSDRGAGFIGGGMKMYTPWHWIGFRVEVRNYFSTLPTPNGTDFTTDLTITAGPTFMIPPVMF